MQCTNKYTARHTISVPAGNGQAGRVPDSRVIYPSSSSDRRNFYSSHMGSAIKAAGGPWPPPKFKLGASNVFGLPQFLGKILLCTQLMYSVFLWKKKQWNACIVVYIVQCSLVQDTAVYTYTHKLTCMTY